LAQQRFYVEECESSSQQDKWWGVLLATYRRR
jgi:hypothetical protein